VKIGAGGWGLGARERKFAVLRHQSRIFWISAYCLLLTAYCFALARISRHGSGRAGLQPRRYKAFLIILVSRAPRSPALAGLRGARDQQRAGAAIPAGLKPRPSGSP